MRLFIAIQFDQAHISLMRSEWGKHGMVYTELGSVESMEGDVEQ